MEKLSFSEKIVGKMILNGGIDLTRHSITQAAKICNVSPSLINKFCIKIGAPGWKTLKGLSFIDLRSKQELSKNIISENFILLENTFINKEIIIKKFIEKFFLLTKNKEIIIFANGTTKKIVEIICHKWNKLGGKRMIVYNYNESIISLNRSNVILYISISGINKKIKYYQRQFLKNKEFFITFGENNDFIGEKLALCVYNNFDKMEKSFPIVTDVFLQLLLNKLIEEKIKNTPGIKKIISQGKMSEI